ncbi:hypothetical protein LguiA_012718 [Lonicera macranthoides]
MAKRKLSALDQGYGSSSSTSRGEYEVFLSFNGTDTRKGFTDFLYTYLVNADIRTFRDDDELRVGEEIGPELLKAIKESKISIPIFSKNYASSKWGLRELAQIVECHTNEEQMIYPIFYDVNPNEVRDQSGSYEDAFSQHKNNFNEMTVHGWKEAMRKVGRLKGYELIKETNGREGQLVKKVVEDVLLGLKKNYTQLPDNLVGLDDHIKAMKELLNVDSNGIRVVGIHGIGGLGKTTIAKVIYNQLCEGFECCCFIEDVRANSEGQNGIVNLQAHLLCKIQKREIARINNVDEGVKQIKDAVGMKKVIIVLDDVDDIYQFDKLVGKCNWFGAGSRVIVTTRNKGLLDTIEATYEIENLHDVYGSYEPHLMESNHSLQLFSKCAFMRDSPPEDYGSLAQKVVSSAGGLPLVLVTLGSLLFGKKDIDLWEEKLRKLKEIPAEKVLERLKISFDALDHGQRQIFLDIACFFIGEDYMNPFYFWEACGFYPRDGLNALVLGSMIKIEDDNKLRMHDQLRDLGRQIVREENMDKPGECSRLWCSEQASKLWEGRMGMELDLDVLHKMSTDFVSKGLVIYIKGTYGLVWFLVRVPLRVAAGLGWLGFGGVRMPSAARGLESYPVTTGIRAWLGNQAIERLAEHGFARWNGKNLIIWNRGVGVKGTHVDLGGKQESTTRVKEVTRASGVRLWYVWACSVSCAHSAACCRWVRLARIRGSSDAERRAGARELPRDTYASWSSHYTYWCCHFGIGQDDTSAVALLFSSQASGQIV